jgi:uncharacterized membrane protein
MITPFERLMGRLLGLGVTVSTVLLAAGLVLTFAGRAEGAAWLLDTGLIVLMATPVTRVVLACAEFTRSRDWLFAAASLGVLGVLGMTAWVAFSGG